MITAQIFFSLLLIILVHSETTSYTDEVIHPENNIAIEKSKVTFWYFSKENPINGVSINKDSLSKLDDTSFSKTKDTIFMVHGYNSTNRSAFISTVKRAIITNLDVNVFVYDWSQIAAKRYILVRMLIPQIAKFLSEFIKSLMSSYDLSLSRTTLVGHSVGCHVVGIAGADLNGSVSVIVGLDPALLLFSGTANSGRLDATDSQFVQVIHTNGDLKGLHSPIGDSDYYPNGGKRQPGCGLDFDGSCAHARAFKYYAESLGSDRFLAVSCNNYDDFTDGKCKNESTSVMGTYHIDKSASGKYYLNTNSEPPYAKAEGSSTSQKNVLIMYITWQFYVILVVHLMSRLMVYDCA